MYMLGSHSTCYSQHMCNILTIFLRDLQLMFFISFICNFFLPKLIIEGTPAASVKKKFNKK